MAASGGSLNLLQIYDSSGSDDEQVPGPRVSTKRTLSKEWACQDTKKKCNPRLPVPQALSTMFSEENNPTVDDPSQHDGRQRSFPHERGNWSTHVYIPFDPVEPWHKLASLLGGWQVNGTTLKLIDEPHLSLSRTVVLRHHWIDSFLSDLRTSFQHMPRFEVCLSGFKVFLNDEKTRTFLGICAYTGSKQLQALSQITDKTLAEFKLPPFYEECSFHISVAWCLGDHQMALQASLAELEDRLVSLHVPCSWPLNVSQAHCRCGNKIFPLPLAT